MQGRAHDVGLLGDAVLVAADDLQDRLDADALAPVRVERVECPEAVELFEQWRAEHPDRWTTPRVDTW